MLTPETKPRQGEVSRQAENSIPDQSAMRRNRQCERESAEIESRHPIDTMNKEISWQLLTYTIKAPKRI